MFAQSKYGYRFCFDCCTQLFRLCADPISEHLIGCDLVITSGTHKFSWGTHAIDKLDSIQSNRIDRKQNTTGTAIPSTKVNRLMWSGTECCRFQSSIDVWNPVVRDMPICAVLVCTFNPVFCMRKEHSAPNTPPPRPIDHCHEGEGVGHRFTSRMWRCVLLRIIVLSAARPPPHCQSVLLSYAVPVQSTKHSQQALVSCFFFV